MLVRTQGRRYGSAREFYLRIALCCIVLDDLERGGELIRHYLSLESLSLERKEALVDGAERLLVVSILLEPLLSILNDTGAISEAIRDIVICLEVDYE